MKNVEIIGAGLSGCVMARLLADKGYRVTLYEKENHIGGLLYDENYNNVYYQMKGPHVFHTNNEKIVNFLTRFTDIINFPLSIRANIDKKITFNPFNFSTIDTFYDEEKAKVLKEKLYNKYGNETTITKLLDDEDSDIKEYANFLYEKDYKQYTSKQWGIDPETIDKSVLARVPVRFNYDTVFRNEKYIFLPKEGYHNMLKKMIDHENIKLVLNKQIFKKDAIYTGPIDELLNYKFGKLAYRSLRFEFKRNEEQKYPVIVYPSLEYRHTRVCDYKQFYTKNKGSILAYEYPEDFDGNNDRCYPILTEENKKKYQKYKEEAKDLILFGRLAEFKYYDMDTIIERAFEISGGI